MNFSFKFLYGFFEGWIPLSDTGYDEKIRKIIFNCLRICIIFMFNDINGKDIFLYKKRTSDNKSLFRYCIRFMNHEGFDKKVYFHQIDLRKKYFDAYICKKVYEEFSGKSFDKLDKIEQDELICSFKKLEI